MPSKKNRLPFDWAEAVEHLNRSDKKVGKIISRVGPAQLELEDLSNTFEALAESVIHQQLTGKAAASIVRRFQDMFGQGDWPNIELIAQTPADELRKAGLSGAKARSIHELAQLACQGSLPSVDELSRLSDDEIVERLTAVRGIGPWTVHMLLIFRLGRPDVMPATDYGVRKGFALTMKHSELPTPKELRAHAERWRPFRTVASWYMWRATELDA